VKVIQDFHRRD